MKKCFGTELGGFSLGSVLLPICIIPYVLSSMNRLCILART